MPNSLKVFFLLIPVVVVIDYLWLARIMGNFYLSRLSSVVRMKNASLDPILWAAMMVYICIPAGIVLFVLPHIDPENIRSSSLFWGFVFGIVLYGTYDMTNHSLLRVWPVSIVIVDILWGGILCAISSWIASLLLQWMSAS